MEKQPKISYCYRKRAEEIDVKTVYKCRYIKDHSKYDDGDFDLIFQIYCKKTKNWIEADSCDFNFN